MAKCTHRALLKMDLLQAGQSCMAMTLIMVMVPLVTITRIYHLEAETVAMVVIILLGTIVVGTAVVAAILIRSTPSHACQHPLGVPSVMAFIRATAAASRIAVMCAGKASR